MESLWVFSFLWFGLSETFSTWLAALWQTNFPHNSMSVSFFCSAVGTYLLTLANELVRNLVYPHGYSAVDTTLLLSLEESKSHKSAWAGLHHNSFKFGGRRWCQRVFSATSHFQTKFWRVPAGQLLEGLTLCRFSLSIDFSGPRSFDRRPRSISPALNISVQPASYIPIQQSQPTSIPSSNYHSISLYVIPLFLLGTCFQLLSTVRPDDRHFQTRTLLSVNCTTALCRSG